jgi:hypothetical protein
MKPAEHGPILYAIDRGSLRNRRGKKTTAIRGIPGRTPKIRCQIFLILTTTYTLIFLYLRRQRCGERRAAKKRGITIARSTLCARRLLRRNSLHNAIRQGSRTVRSGGSVNFAQALVVIRTSSCHQSPSWPFYPQAVARDFRDAINAVGFRARCASTYASSTISRKDFQRLHRAAQASTRAYGATFSDLWNRQSTRTMYSLPVPSKFKSGEIPHADSLLQSDNHFQKDRRATLATIRD